MPHFRCAHIRKGFRESEENIFCGFGGELRPVSFKVAECTDYANRAVPYRYELEQMALLIDVPRARKGAGFSGVGFVAEDNTARATSDCSSSVAKPVAPVAVICDVAWYGS